jgi:transcription elongation factor GreB
MGRYRPPGPKSSKYITPEGAQALRRELDELWRTRRPEVTRAVAEAAAQGDRSENADYIYGKKQLAEIDRRVRYLRKRLEGMRVVETVPSDPGKVYFGAWIELRDAAGTTTAHRIVGPDESSAAPAYISMDSPLARAVMGKARGDEVVVTTPEGERRLTIANVRYGPPPGKKEPGTRPGQSQGKNEVR